MNQKTKKFCYACFRNSFNHFLILFLITTNFLFAQNIKDEDVEYRYIKLPSSPVDRSIKNYQSTIAAPYEVENDKKKAEYDAQKKQAQADFQAAKAVYPAKVKAAEEDYNKEMEAWKKKSLGQKMVEKEVLGENNKPVKSIPPEPSLAYVPEPKLRTSYDYQALASTYVHLDGFENKNENALKILVTLYGYDYTEPRQLSEQKDMVKTGNGQTQTYKATYYHTEFSYRHPMSVKVTTADGKEILNLTPQELNNYKVYKSSDSQTPPQMSNEMLVKSFEEKILQENLKFINNLLNDKFGFERALRKTELNYVKSKDETYQDLLVAFNDASSALKVLVDDAATAKTKLQSAAQSWEAALKESDPKNKKARIDKDVTIAVCFNLLEGYFALGNSANAEKIFTVLNTLDLSSRNRKQKEEYEALFIDFKKRVAVNN